MKSRLRHVRGQGGASLPEPLRQLLEQRFAADLSAVRLHRCAAAAALTGNLRASACAVDGTILLAPGPVTAAVLAHEVAHVLQQRRRGLVASRAALENEASRASPVTLAADPSQPLCWEEAGHYYTVYFVALAVGVSNRDAGRMAFWSQMPDEVLELDAVPAGKAVAGKSSFIAFSKSLVNPRGAIAPFGPRLQNNSRSDDPFGQFSINLDVQKGLHCLTGNHWDAETSRRLKLSLATPVEADHFEFGLSLHSFGDSFAHRDHQTGRMYPPFLGHGPETVASHASSEIARFLGQEHADGLSYYRRELYGEYVLQLYKLLMTRAPRTAPIRLSAVDTCDWLDTIIVENPDKKESEAQCWKIRDLAQAHMGIVMNGYTPEGRGDVPFVNLYDHLEASHLDALDRLDALDKSHRRMTVGHVNRALALASKWAN